MRPARALACLIKSRNMVESGSWMKAQPQYTSWSSTKIWVRTGAGDERSTLVKLPSVAPETLCERFSFCAHRAHQPCLSKVPVPPHGLDRHSEHFSGLFDTQAAEKPKLYHTRFSSVLFREGVQRVVKRHDFAVLFRSGEKPFVERHFR